MRHDMFLMTFLEVDLFDQTSKFPKSTRSSVSWAELPIARPVITPVY